MGNVTNTVEVILGVIVFGVILANVTGFATALKAIGNVFTSAVDALSHVARGGTTSPTRG